MSTDTSRKSCCRLLPGKRGENPSICGLWLACNFSQDNMFPTIVSQLEVMEKEKNIFLVSKHRRKKLLNRWLTMWRLGPGRMWSTGDFLLSSLGKTSLWWWWWKLNVKCQMLNCSGVRILENSDSKVISTICIICIICILCIVIFFKIAIPIFRTIYFHIFDCILFCKILTRRLSS